MGKYRKVSQGIFLLLFLFLFFQTETKGDDVLGYPVRIFLDMDPLIFLTVLLSARTIVPGLLLSFIVIILTASLGRVFCGWICPLGTLNNIAGTFTLRQKEASHRNWFRIKYYVLFFLIASSAFTVQIAGFLDPISLLIRSLSLSINPALGYVLESLIDLLYKVPVPFVQNVGQWLHRFLTATVLSMEQTYYYQAFIIGLVLVFILLLNLLEQRFWYRYLCPLGALLGIISRFSLLKRSVGEGCTECGACEKVCPSGAIIDGKGTARMAECLVCMDCYDTCPVNAIDFTIKADVSQVPVNIDRRRTLLSLLAGITIVPIFKIVPLSRASNFQEVLIRPPGSCPEEEFLSRCIRCGECMKVCITNGLQPSLTEAGAEGIWTPILVPKIGHCEYRCTLCGQVCPTGAIVKLSPEEKIKTQIGTAVIDAGRCLPYAYEEPCIVCEEMCPTPRKAIFLETVKIEKSGGTTFELKRPRVDPRLCIGCGACESHCPVAAKPAIHVISTGEDRSEDNRFLL